MAIKVRLVAATLILWVMTAQAEQFGSSLLQASACPQDTPFLTATKAVQNHAYVGMAYARDNRWHGALLSYRTLNGVMMGADGLPIYQDNQMTVRADVWASGTRFEQFGTQSRLAQTGTIGAVMYPPSVDMKSGALLYADTHGVLRLVDGATGRQLMAYSTGQDLGEMGVDAHWRLYRIKDSERDNRERLLAVGGFGISAKGLLVLDVSDVIQGGQPTVLYRLSERDAGFAHLSHIHAPISLGYMKQNNKKVVVFVFGAGADECYQHGLNCQKNTADGSAVYAIHAITGQKIKEWSNQTLPNQGIRHSFAGELTLIDRQGDGTFEQVYAADLGGQIFRFNKSGDDAALIFRASDESLSLFDKRRVHFYQKPIISLYDSQEYPLYPKRFRRFALISIASNDQLPIISGKKNHVYGIFDDGLIDLKYRPTITPDSLVLIDDAKQTPTAWAGAVARAKGWARVLNMNGDTDVTLMSAGYVAPSGSAFRRAGVRSLYHLSVAKILDCPQQMTTQLQAYCLPFGVCVHQQTGQVMTGSPNQTALTSAIISGNWTPSFVKLSNQNVLTWQNLSPNDDAKNALSAQNNPFDDKDNQIDKSDQSLSTAFTRVLKFLRWYDVRSTKD